MELMEAAYEAISRKDLDAFPALAHPEIEFRSLIAEADGRTFHGHQGVRDWWDSVILSLVWWASFRSEAEALEAAGLSE